ncbi:agmatine deiminase family protein, partial [Clostridium perfringens]
GVLMAIEDTEVRKRNPKYSKEQIEEEFKKLFNLKKVIWLPYPSFEDEEVYDGVLDIIDGNPVFRSLSANGHIDEMCRFVGENTVLLAEITEEEAEELESARITKERFDQAYEILKNETDAEGNP